MEIIKETKFIRFIKLDKPKNHKTDIVEIYNSSDDLLGTIKWYGPWRKYCFYPAELTLFDYECLNTILEVLDKMQMERMIHDI